MTQIETSDVPNGSSGPRLLWAKIAAGLLAAYAVVYAMILLSFADALSFNRGDGLFVFGLLALATTPFFAFFQLLRASRNDPNKPVRPVVMVLVMAAPAAFWTLVSIDDLAGMFRNPRETITVFGMVWMPALLSLTLVGVFAWLAWRKFRPTRPANAD